MDTITWLNTAKRMRAILLFPLMVLVIALAIVMVAVPMGIYMLSKNVSMADVWSSCYHVIVDYHALLNKRWQLPMDDASDLMIYFLDLAVILIFYTVIIYIFI